MSESFRFEEVDLLTVGTLGPKGQRVFYLQCVAHGEIVSLKFEKGQAAALAEYLDKMLRELPGADASELPRDLDMREPVIEAWAIGALGIAYDERGDRVILVAEEARRGRGQRRRVGSLLADPPSGRGVGGPGPRHCGRGPAAVPLLPAPARTSQRPLVSVPQLTARTLLPAR